MAAPNQREKGNWGCRLPKNSVSILYGRLKRLTPDDFIVLSYIWALKFQQWGIKYAWQQSLEQIEVATVYISAHTFPTESYNKS